MIPPQLLGGLSNLHELLTQLAKELPERHVNQRFHPDLPSIGWLLGLAVYTEIYWLREQLEGDNDLSQRVQHLFADPAGMDQTLDQQLPPREHLLNWAMEIFDNDLTRLANPGALQQHRLLHDGWLVGYLAQLHARIYERMLSVLTARSLTQQHDDYQVQEIVKSQPPTIDAISVNQGHYRIGAREGVVFDNEQPVQVVELHSYRIMNAPVTNAEYLSFMHASGYSEGDFWTDSGNAWRDQGKITAPWHWRQDKNGQWYALGLNGPVDLIANDPVSGLSHHEATAFANWAAAENAVFTGAVLQHEFQWEAAARTQGLRGSGRSWEWCSNKLEPYDQYQAPEDPQLATAEFDGQHFSLRGGCLHTQHNLRRASYRHSGLPDARHLFSGTRLVLPPE